MRNVVLVPLCDRETIGEETECNGNTSEQYRERLKKDWEIRGRNVVLVPVCVSEICEEETESKETECNVSASKQY